MKAKKTVIGLISIIVLMIILFAIFVGYYGDWLWFRNLGYTSVFNTMVIAKISIFSIFFIIFLVLSTINIAIARRIGNNTRQNISIVPEDPNQALLLLFKGKTAKYVWGVIILLLAVILGVSASGYWESFLQFLHSSKFGITEPIFGKDAGFYVFKLPIYNFLQGWYLSLVVIIFISVLVSYSIDNALSFTDNRFKIIPKAKHHLSILLGFFLLGLAYGYRLKLYMLLYSQRGVAYGPSYTDVHIQIPAYYIILVITFILAFIFLLEPLFKKGKIIKYSVITFIVALVGIVWIYPPIIQQYVVKPNELLKETPYINNNIKLTRFAYGLNKIEEKKFDVNQEINFEDIRKNHHTIKNIRLWDRRPLIQTYKQLQEIRLYYDFNNVDVDRYHFGNKYTEVALAARELPASQIPVRARTWVNTHLIYTHGYGVVMSPVNEVTKNGMPNFIIHDIPPVSDVPLVIKNPAIYYGEQTNEYAIVHTRTKEFDYPKGDDNAYTEYSGRGGVRISNFFKRLVYAWNFSDMKILLTGYITDESRIMFYRNIVARDAKIAPFLTYDSDPYLVCGNDGKIYWIHDAYTTTNMFPYSEPVVQNLGERGANYIRNSVKVVIDAYNGDVSYYVVNPNDPIIKTYEKVFPNFFKPFSEMPVFLKKHIRYPMDMFDIQTHMYNVYHMTDPQVFYNQEDYWQVPMEIYRNSKQEMLPYYIIMKLPKGTSEECILMLPLTPSNKDNMVAWMCARCDAPNYGELIVYDLPKDKLIYGPMQIEARINQKPNISSGLTLWSQKGSHVIRGNQLIIPINKSFIYVEPVYLQSDQGEIPQLKRVIVAFKEKIEMEKTLDQALRSVFQASNVPDVETTKAISGKIIIESLPTKAKQALSHYNKAVKFLKNDNWAAYGEELNKMKQILVDMSKNKKITKPEK